METIEFFMPIKTVSESNNFDPWRKKSARHKSQKISTRFCLLQSRGTKEIKIPCKIKLTRISPRFLDEHDNLRVSLKYILDALCEEIMDDRRSGRADSLPGLSFEYAQEKSKNHGVKVEISW
jgi:hypothetical protein